MANTGGLVPGGLPTVSDSRVSRPSIVNVDPLKFTSDWTPGKARAASHKGILIRCTTIIMVRLALFLEPVESTMSRKFVSFAEFAAVSAGTPLIFASLGWQSFLTRRVNVPLRAARPGKGPFAA